MKQKVIVKENFIEDLDLFRALRETVLKLPFFYMHSIGSPQDTEDFCFMHRLYENNQQHSTSVNATLMPLLGRLTFNYLLRAKINFYTKKSKFIKTAFHVDSEEPHQVALYSLNTNNGYTLFEDGTKISSVENQIIMFDGALKHCSASPTDTNIRINININTQ
tara:strand:- start:191 stop:679 length:489 start_codon:yes stop_codon:yes gene_type:complete